MRPLKIRIVLIVNVNNTALRTIRAALLTVCGLTALRGTPSPTRPADVFVQGDALRPGLLGGSLSEFMRAYCYQGSSGPHWTWGRGKRAEELNLLLRHCIMLRRRKAEVVLN